MTSLTDLTDFCEKHKIPAHNVLEDGMARGIDKLDLRHCLVNGEETVVILNWGDTGCRITVAALEAQLDELEESTANISYNAPAVITKKVVGALLDTLKGRGNQKAPPSFDM